ncbi:Transposase [Pseudomonas sp. 24 E 13]|nr:Transposase [Pseudomonas sp. 44 R 15]CRM80383.1 Transposase [Pseudomonas sp. 24 E 13]
MGKTVETIGKKTNRDQTVIEKLTFEIAQLKRLKFAKRSEQMNPEQASLLDDLIDTDIATIEAELQALQTAPAPTEKKQNPQRTALPAEFPRTLIHHEPDNTHCPCGCALKRIGADAHAGNKENPSLLCLGLRHQPILGSVSGGLRFQPQPRR